jgi:hypothetical protein
MDPRQVSQQLLRIANYLEKNPSPSAPRVLAGLAHVVQCLPKSSVAADVKQFTQKEFSDAIESLDTLITRFQKILDGMNPQDPVYLELQERVKSFTQHKDQLLADFNSLNAQV